MTTINRTVETEHDKKLALNLIENRAIPFTLSITDGKHRSTAQNKLQMLWMNEISQQRGDMKPEEVRAYCKLTIGVPILRAENEAFREGYDRVVKPLPYDQKIAIMMEPLDLPVTRIMTTKQKTEYLDGIIRHFAEQGIVLTMPDDMRFAQSETSASPPQGEADELENVVAATSPVDPAGEPSISPAGSVEPDMFGKFNFGEGELVHLKDLARKALDDAASDNDVPAKEAAIAKLFDGYADAIESAEGRKAMAAMSKPLAAVVDGKRTRQQGADFIARDVLGVKPEELEGRK